MIFIVFIQMKFSQVTHFVSQNRQAFMNMIGMGIIFNYSVHNYRLKIAWDEHELEMRKIQAESQRIKDALSDVAWQGDVQDKIYARKTTLAKELEARFAEPVEPTAKDRVLAQERELSRIEAELGVSLGGEKEKTKII